MSTSRILLLLFTVSIIPLLAQSPVGDIAGIVNDPSGAFIAGATVTAMSAATGASAKRG